MSGDVSDAFICHASEDKARFVEPLVAALASLGVTAWYDRLQIAPGDNIPAKIDEGLSTSTFGVVVVSPRFWKYWTGEEVAALHALESLDRDRARRIIPVWCEVELADLAKKSPLLAGRLGLHWGLGVDGVAREIVRAMGKGAAPPIPVPPSMARARPYNLPARRSSRVFVGREADLAKLDAALAPGRHVGLAASVEGLAGVGKTELALQLVERLASSGRFPGGIFWLEAEAGDLTTQWGGKIAEDMAMGDGDPVVRTRAVHRVIESGGPALVVLDNVTAWSSTAAPRPLPTGPHIAVLATTQVRDLGGTDFEHLTIDVLSAKAARELLLELIGDRRGGEVGLEDLLTYLGGHPLALQLAGAYLRAYRDVDARAYLARLQAGEPVEDKVADQPRYERTVRAAIAATVERLDAQARKALWVAAWFADADATVTLLRACGVTSDLERSLQGLHLLSGDGKTWSMHRLVRKHAHDGLDETSLRKSREAFWTGCIEKIEKSPGQASAYRADRVHYIAHAERAMSGTDLPMPVSLGVLRRVGIAARAAGDTAAAARYLGRAGEHWEQVHKNTQNIGKVEGWHEAPDGTRTPLLSPEVQTALNIDRLTAEQAWVQIQSGDYRGAAGTFEQVISRVEKHPGIGDEILYGALRGLVSAYAGAGHGGRAEQIARRLLTWSRDWSGSDSPETQEALAVLATALVARGQAHQAVAVYAKSLALSARRGEPPEPNTLAGLGYAHSKLGNYAEAARLIREGLALHIRQAGATDHGTLQMRVNLADILLDAGDGCGARQELLATEPQVDALPRNHPVVALWNIVDANVKVTEGDVSGAKAAAARAESVAIQLSQEGHFVRDLRATAARILGGG